MATSASRLPTSTAISLVTATPADTSTGPAKRRVNASISGLTTNSANVDEATTRSCSGAPCAARTAACASAPSTTICEAVASSREPPAVSVIPLGPRLTSWSPRCWRSAVSACETADSLTPSAFAAEVTEPSRATSTNALSCVSVMTCRLVAIQSWHWPPRTEAGLARRFWNRPLPSDYYRSLGALVHCAHSGDLEGERMQVPAYVEYEKATSVAHALALLARFGPEARILAGGHSLIPMMKLRLAQPETLIDINGLSELSYLTVTGGELRIGAMTRHAQLLDSPRRPGTSRSCTTRSRSSPTRWCGTGAPSAARSARPTRPRTCRRRSPR